jgi:pilus assembly protein CpaC
MTMRESSLVGVRARWRKQFLASALCTAGFLAGHVLCAGDDPALPASQPTPPPAAPLAIWNEYAQARDAVAEAGGRKSEVGGQNEFSREPEASAANEGSGFGVQGSGKALKPAAISVAEDAIEPALPAIISPSEARPLRKIGRVAATPAENPTATTGRGFGESATAGRGDVAPQFIENTTLAEASGGRQPTELEVGGRKSGLGDRNELAEAPIARIAALPLPIEETSLARPVGIEPLTTHHSPRTTSTPEPRPLVGALAEEDLPPIVPASAMPRKVAGTLRMPSAEARGQKPADRGQQAAPWMQEIRTALQAEDGGQRTEDRGQRTENGGQAEGSTLKPAQFTRDDDADLFAAQQPAPPAAQPPAVLAPMPAGPAIGPLPAGSPFEAVTESGTVTLRVRRSLLMRTKVDIYRTAVVDESICDIVQFTPREISLIGRAQGSTHVTFWFDDPAQPPLTYLVKVEPDADAIKRDEYKYQMLEDLVNEMFPDSKIRLVVLADKLLVKGQAKDSEEAAQIMTIVRTQGQSGAYGVGGGLIGVGDTAATGVIPAAAAGQLANQPAYQIVNMLRVPGVQQVALRVKIAELNRSSARGFGVNVETNIEFGDAVNGSKLLLASLLNTQGSTSVIADISGDDASLGIRYLQQHGVVRLLSEPTLVTLSGKPATFVAGGEFAVPTVVGSVGLNAVTTDFRAFGAIISFLPTVVDKDRVRLQVAPEFSQINNSLTVGGTPGLNVRSATTTVEMREGQTLAIAGLLEDNYKASNVGDLPFLAKIFGRRDTSRNETELIILVTPELVHPMEPEEVPPLPGFDVTEPTNAEFFLHGDIEGHPSREYRSTVWPRLKKRYGGPAMTSGPFGHGQ